MHEHPRMPIQVLDKGVWFHVDKCYCVELKSGLKSHRTQHKSCGSRWFLLLCRQERWTEPCIHIAEDDSIVLISQLHFDAIHSFINQKKIFFFYFRNSNLRSFKGIGLQMTNSIRKTKSSPMKQINFSFDCLFVFFLIKTKKPLWLLINY